MLPDRESNPGPLTYESGALPIALHGPAWVMGEKSIKNTRIKILKPYAHLHIIGSCGDKVMVSLSQHGR